MRLKGSWASLDSGSELRSEGSCMKSLPPMLTQTTAGTPGTELTASVASHVLSLDLGSGFGSTRLCLVQGFRLRRWDRLRLLTVYKVRKQCKNSQAVVYIMALPFVLRMKEGFPNRYLNPGP